MSSNNNDNAGIASAVGLASTVMIFMGMAFFAIAAFVTVILTILAVIACFKPIRLGKWVMNQDEASAFLMRGVVGLWLLPAFVLFCQIIFNIYIDWNYLPHIMGVGYVAGSLGWEFLKANDNASTVQPQAEILPPARQVTHQSQNLPSAPRQQQEPEPFLFASWDDEEEMRK